jgi:heme oxygenase
LGRSLEESTLPGHESQPAGLADLLRARTHVLHAQAERSGVIADLLRGRASRRAYALLLRNLLPAYQELEAGLERHRHRPGLAALANPAVYRASALAADLCALESPGWVRSVPLLEAGQRYARRVAEAAEGDGTRLIGHAYVRFLGDLNGGRILCERLARSLDLGPDALGFYAYPQSTDLDVLRIAYRNALDRAGVLVAVAPVVEEALVAFRLNIELAEAVQTAAAPPGG